MKDVSTQHEELQELLISLTDGEIDGGRFDRLQSILLRDAEAQAYFRRYMRLCALLEFDRAESEGEQSFDLDNDCQNTLGDHKSDAPFPSLSPLPSLSTTHYQPSTNFVGGPVFSYMVATVVVCAMLLSAWAYKITHSDGGFVNNPKPFVAPREQVEFAGRITGMVDCRWSDPDTRPYAGSYVPLGRKYELTSGLLEITYTSGARVILEGPCSYTVDSEAGGYLGQGKLTARIEKRGEKSEERREAAEKASRVNSPVPSLPSPAPLFSVITPTAVVTDLGTEFGVAVDKDQGCIVHVFAGQVGVAPCSLNGERKASSRLLAGQMLGVDNNGTKQITRSGLKPMEVLLKHFQSRGFVHDFRFGDKGMILTGSAQIKGEADTGYVTRLRLTNNRANQIGSAWHAKKQTVIYGFTTDFLFQFTFSHDSGADGIAFVIQNTSTGGDLIVGEKGADGHALNVCFDSFKNANEGDPSNACITVREGNKIIAQADLHEKLGISDLSDSRVYTARIDYAQEKLDVYLNDTLVLEKVPVDLADLVGGSAIDDDGQAWVGFGARTGRASENHDVLTWRFLSK